MNDLEISKLHLFIVCMCSWMWRSDNNLQKSVLASPICESGSWTLVIGLGRKTLKPLR